MGEDWELGTVGLGGIEGSRGGIGPYTLGRYAKVGFKYGVWSLPLLG